MIVKSLLSLDPAPQDVPETRERSCSLGCDLERNVCYWWGTLETLKWNVFGVLSPASGTPGSGQRRNFQACCSVLGSLMFLSSCGLCASLCRN